MGAIHAAASASTMEIKSGPAPRACSTFEIWVTAKREVTSASSILSYRAATADSRLGKGGEEPARGETGGLRGSPPAVEAEEEARGDVVTDCSGLRDEGGCVVGTVVGMVSGWVEEKKAGAGEVEVGGATKERAEGGMD